MGEIQEDLNVLFLLKARMHECCGICFVFLSVSPFAVSLLHLLPSNSLFLLPTISNNLPPVTIHHLDTLHLAVRNLRLLIP